MACASLCMGHTSSTWIDPESDIHQSRYLCRRHICCRSENKHNMYLYWTRSNGLHGGLLRRFCSGEENQKTYCYALPPPSPPPSSSFCCSLSHRLTGREPGVPTEHEKYPCCSSAQFSTVYACKDIFGIAVILQKRIINLAIENLYLESC